jgi:hypothetical protein
MALDVAVTLFDSAAGRRSGNDLGGPRRVDCLYKLQDRMNWFAKCGHVVSFRAVFGAFCFKL